MTIPAAGSALTYVIIFFASAIEGEVMFVAASVLVGIGQLPAVPVLVCGALGASAGDQFYYYAARGWLGERLRRGDFARARREALLRRVRAHGAWMGFACRFLPGLRIAIGVTCAMADVRAVRFSGANLAGAFAWAAGVMAFVAWGGPAWLARSGLPGWIVWILPAVVVVSIVVLLSRTQSA